MRLFIAVDLSKSLKEKLSALQEKLKASSADVKWVEKQNLHITLKFLGEVPESRLEEIRQKLEAVSKEHDAFKVEIAGSGGFPGLKSIRVVWAGIKDGVEYLARLIKNIENKMEELGFPKEERVFKGHLTLGRTRSPKNKEKLHELLIKEQEINMGTEAVEKITLFQSILSKKGPEYKVVREFPLMKGI